MFFLVGKGNRKGRWFVFCKIVHSVLSLDCLTQIFILCGVFFLSIINNSPSMINVFPLLTSVFQRKFMDSQRNPETFRSIQGNPQKINNFPTKSIFPNITRMLILEDHHFPSVRLKLLMLTLQVHSDEVVTTVLTDSDSTCTYLTPACSALHFRVNSSACSRNVTCELL